MTSALTATQLSADLYLEIASWLADPQDVRHMAMAITRGTEEIDAFAAGPRLFAVAAHGAWRAAALVLAPHIQTRRSQTGRASERDTVLGHFSWRAGMEETGARAFLTHLQTGLPGGAPASLRDEYQEVQHLRPDLFPDGGWRVWEDAWRRHRRRMGVFGWLERLSEHHPHHRLLVACRPLWRLIVLSSDTMAYDFVVTPGRLLDMCGALRLCAIVQQREPAVFGLAQEVNRWLYAPASNDIDLLPDAIRQACEQAAPTHLRLLEEQRRRARLLADPAQFFLAGEGASMGPL